MNFSSNAQVKCVFGFFIEMNSDSGQEGRGEGCQNAGCGAAEPAFLGFPVPLSSKCPWVDSMLPFVRVLRFLVCCFCVILFLVYDVIPFLTLQLVHKTKVVFLN